MALKSATMDLTVRMPVSIEFGRFRIVPHHTAVGSRTRAGYRRHGTRARTRRSRYIARKRRQCARLEAAAPAGCSAVTSISSAPPRACRGTASRQSGSPNHEPLRAQGECLYRVPPLAVPMEGSQDAEDPLRYGAVRARCRGDLPGTRRHPASDRAGRSAYERARGRRARGPPR
jgi:hypothetical protein